MAGTFLSVPQPVAGTEAGVTSLAPLGIWLLAEVPPVIPCLQQLGIRGSSIALGTPPRGWHPSVLVWLP